MKVRIPAEDRYVYPDLSIVCDPVRLDPLQQKPTAILNPRVVIEVLSESTEHYDRGRKFEAYRTIESLEEYILVSQSRAYVESFLRQPDGTWSFAVFDEIGHVVRIRCMGIELPMSEIYANISFDEPSEP